MKRNGFTLIELLVVVAIIGILAAVGVVAYSGYTSAAKIRVVKANHKIVHNWLQQETMKCTIHQDPMYPILKGTHNSGYYCRNVSAFFVASLVASTGGILRDKIKNPYGCSAFCKKTGYGGAYNTLSYGDASKKFNIQNQLGVIFLQAVDDDGNDAFSNSTATGIKVTSCNKLPCDPTTGEGYMKTTFAVDEF